MSEPYLPRWATALEAAEWLEFKTGQRWPLPRILEAHPAAAFHLVPAQDQTAEQLKEVFGGNAGGIMAVIQPTDMVLFAASRSDLNVSLVGLPDGRAAAYEPPLQVPADEVRFLCNDIRRIAQRLEEGAKFDTPPSPLVLRGDGLELQIPPFGLELHGPPVKIELMMLNPLGPPQADRMAAETPPAPASKPASPDLSMLTTRDKLIDAFGAFTGMGRAWFDNLKDTPALLAARKVPGQGGRGHIAEPWFCPLEVMQWLIDPKRKKGRAGLGELKGWELLEKHFPKVYAANSVGDPRED